MAGDLDDSAEGAPRERERHLDRFLTFIDAMVAIAMTLLVLPLVELSGEVDSAGSVAELLREDQAEFWAFLLSFVVIARFWFAHHEAVRHLVLYNRRIARLTVWWALTIVFLPFPTALVAQASDDPLTKILYMGTMSVSAALVATIEAYLARHHELTDGQATRDPLAAVVNALLMLVALVISLAIPATSYFPILLVLLAAPIARLWRRRHAPRRTVA